MVFATFERRVSPVHHRSPDSSKNTAAATATAINTNTKRKGPPMIAEAIDDISPAVRANAACNDLQGSLTGVFFSEELQDIAAAKAICATCPVIVECLEGAIARHEPWGVWGGQMFLNGKILATKRRRGRPPKTPRPEDQLPEIPVPAHLQVHLRSA